MVAAGSRPVHASGECEIDLVRRELRVLGTPVPVGGRAFDIIEILAQSAGRLVTKDELMRRVWPGAIVLENTLRVHTAALRKALGPYRAMLRTESGRGYRLVGNWTVRARAPVTTPADPRQSKVSGGTSTNLPAVATDLIGRSVAMQKLRDLVAAYRVVTVTGPGGIGKTALALEVARGLLAEFDDGGWLVELAPLSDPGLVPSTVAGVLGLTLGGEEISAEAVTRAVGEQKLLLVLDNCEHVIDSVANLAEVFVRSCPRTTILATSREVFRIEGECVYRVPPLEIPAFGRQEPTLILRYSAVELFIARTKALNSDFSSQAENLPTIAEVCRHLDGIPLAIEFAAARTAALGIEQVAAGLRDRFALLISGRRAAIPRHRTLRATLDWSYDLLPEPERHLLRHLAIFPAGFTLPAAAAVVDDLVGIQSRVANGITSLVYKSLVTVDRSTSTTRWNLLESIRTYALEKLAAHDESSAAARRHAHFYRDLFVSREPDPHVAVEDMEQFTREIDSVRAALDWSFSSAGDAEIGVTLTAAYVPAWLHAALPAECRERTERAMNNLTPGMHVSMRLQVQLQFAYGLMPAYTMSPVEPAKVALNKALALAEQIDDLQAEFQILWGLWVLNSTAGECHTAQSVTEQLLLVAKRIGDPSASLMAQRLYGFVLQQRGQHHQASQRFERVVRHYVAPTDRRLTVWGQFDQRVLARAMLARALWFRGYAEQAMDQARLSLEEAQRANFPLSIAEALRVAVCDIALMTDDLVTADQSITMLIDIATSQNAPFWGISGRCLRGKLLVIRGEFAQGSNLLRTELEFCERAGWPIWYPEFMAAMAEGLVGLGEVAEARAAVDKGLASADRGGERIYYPELLRIKGEILLQQAADRCASAAENCFNKAGELACEQGALFWELRVALSLARLRVAQGRHFEARQILAPVYDRFTEGFETADLRATRAMLDSLAL